MAAITAALIKQVREETGAGMMDVKKALTEAEGDVARAKEIIRAKGIQAAGKREGRKAQEGTIASTVVESANGQTGYAVELNSETDFVAKTPKFVEFAGSVLDDAVKAEASSVDEVLAAASGDTTVKEAVEEAAALCGEHVKVGQLVTGAIYNYTDAGAFLFSNERYIVFIANKEMKDNERPRVGEVVTARVTFVRPDGRLNASLREAKEKALVTDSNRILALLASRKGRMPYSDETSPEVIRDKFQISKAAFKRALGHLMKEGRVAEKDGWTYLLDGKSEAADVSGDSDEKL